MQALATPVITGASAAILTLLIVGLATRVALYRKRHRIGVGDGGDPRLLRRIRAHGNAAEFVPLGLILLLVLELSLGASVWLGAAAAVFTVSRLLHAYGLSRSGGASLPRVLGASLSFLALVVLSLWLLVHLLRHAM